MTHATKSKDITTIEGAGKKRRYFTDNFYKRHNLAKNLKTYSDGEAEDYLIGKCKINIIFNGNITKVQEAVRILTKDEIEGGELTLARSCL